APWVILAASLVFVAASLAVFRRQRALFNFTLLLGALAWAVGNLLWGTGVSMDRVAPWWLAFLILTIAGERLELSRFLPPSPLAQRCFAFVVAAMLAGLAGTGQAWGSPLLAMSLLALAAWLFKQDIARRTVRKRGLTRYIALCLLSGYAWLAIGAAI